MSSPFFRWGNLRKTLLQRSSIPTWHYKHGPELLIDPIDPRRRISLALEKPGGERFLQGCGYQRESRPYPPGIIADP
jgi:hypothetical protein